MSSLQPLRALRHVTADPRASAYVNVAQTLALADRLIGRGIPVLFLSTNQVFDGTVPNVAAGCSA